jgi:hypothetical protein
MNTKRYEDKMVRDIILGTVAAIMVVCPLIWWVTG